MASIALAASATLTTLVTGANATVREAAIAAAVGNLHEHSAALGIILEGLPSGTSPLDDLVDISIASVNIARIAPGCVCCSGNLTMRVTLNRMLRRAPARLYIGLANAEHLEQIRQFLSSPPYDNLLCLTQDLHA